MVFKIRMGLPEMAALCLRGQSTGSDIYGVRHCNLDNLIF